MPQRTSTSVRRIKPRKKGVTGRVGPGREFESLVERDFMQLLLFDLTVKDFRSQPIQIEYEFQGTKHIYTPDFLVHYHPSCKGETPGPLLVEVKPSDNIEEEESLQAAKFKAAQRICEREGWRFTVVTEFEIRTGRLENAQFFQRFMRRTPNVANAERILAAIVETGPVNAQDLLDFMSDDTATQAGMLADLWTLVAQRRILIDYEQAVRMSSTLNLRISK
jgi:hypothetical protein